VVHLRAWGHQAFVLAHPAQWLTLHDSDSQTLQDSASWPFYCLYLWLCVRLCAGLCTHVSPLQAIRARNLWPDLLMWLP
jgi:hypothetical protein